MRSIFAPHRTAVKEHEGVLVARRGQADFTVGPSVLRLVGLALAIGALGALVALVLVDLIGLITNALYFGRLGTGLPSLTGQRLGLWAIPLPVIGGLVVGVMAKLGSEQIRGHGIPEAMENILSRGSRVAPRLAVLKPISSAISIGTGGPFGAEGPIILTGGAVGSLIAQALTLSAAERKVLLVCGASAGMSGVFGTPVAATLLGVELLLFEWKPRSLVPVATASLAAMAVRMELASAGWVRPAPLFRVPPHAVLPVGGMLDAAVVGIACGCLAWVITRAVYAAEDGFRRLRVHWVWWPAIGGLVVGIGGAIDRRALGVGYDTIGAELAGRLAVAALVGLLVVKLIIWAVALGSGNSGGVLAPVLMMGAAAGGVFAPFMDGGSRGFWCLIGLAAALSGVMRTPLTAVIFAFELTYDANALMPLMIAAVSAYLVSVLVLKRSILTEKVARGGVHVLHEYSVDPLEALRVRDVMSSDLATLDYDEPVARLQDLMHEPRSGRAQRLFPVIGADDVLLGVLEAHDLNPLEWGSAQVVGDLARRPIVALPHETLREIADRMIAHDIDGLPVVDGQHPPRLVGLIDQRDLFRAQIHLDVQERFQQRILTRRNGRANVVERESGAHVD
jgi:CIC family chloride channel protein